MSQVPKYAFRVTVIRNNGHANSKAELYSESHNYANLAGALAFRETALRRHQTRKVEVLMILDESTPDHRT